MKKKIRKKKINKSDTETNKVKLISKRKGWFVTEGKNEACTAQQAIPGSAEVCKKDSFTFYNGLHINISQCNALVQNQKISSWNVLTAAM